MIDKKAILEDCRALRRVSIAMLEKAMPDNTSTAERMEMARKIYEFGDTFKAAIEGLERPLSPSPSHTLP